LRHGQRPKEVSQESRIRHAQAPHNPSSEPAEKTIAGAGGINLISLERRGPKRTVFTKNLAPILPVRDDHAAPPSRLLHVDERGLVGGGLEERNSRQQVEEPALAERHVANATVGGTEPSNQTLNVDEHDVADLQHPLESLRENLPADPDSQAEREPGLDREVLRSDSVAGNDAVQEPVRVARTEVGVEEGGSRCGDCQWGVQRCGGGVGKFRAHLGDGVEGEREGVEDDGDEGGGPAQSLGGDAAVSVEDVVAVVADEKAAAGSGCGFRDHEESGGSIMDENQNFFYGLRSF